MDLKNSIIKKGLEDQLFKSILWNTIVEEFKTKKNIDISKYMISINTKGNTIFIKTNKPIINEELLIIQENIMKRFEIKMKNMGFIYDNFNIRYL